MASKDRQKTIRGSRDATVTLTLDLEDGDELVEMISRESGLFCVSRKKILRYRSPDDVDPDLKFESATWNQSLVLPHGASDPIVARTIIQTARIAEIFFPKKSSKYEALSDISWEMMHSLVSLRFIKKRLETQVEELTDVIDRNFDAYTMGRNPKPLPIVEYLDIEFRSFANEVRRALSVVSDLFSPLTGKDKFGQGHFHEAQMWAEKTQGATSLLAQMLRGDQRWIKTWIDIRIAIEHPKKDTFVETMNFSLEPDGTITLPTWRFVHPNYDMARPQNLLDVMNICIENILNFYEDLLITLLDGHLPSSIKITFETIPEKDRDKDLPVRYRFRQYLVNKGSRPSIS
ncbi:MAG: hypothetical protein AB7E95_06695 [Kiritimatiellales bacterium]